MPDDIPFVLSDYLELVDWSGRIIREDKKGHIPEHLPGILQRLDIDPSNWVYLTKNFEHPFKNLVSAAYHVRQACEGIGKTGYTGPSSAKNYFLALNSSQQSLKEWADRISSWFSIVYIKDSCVSLAIRSDKQAFLRRLLIFCLTRY